MKRVKALREASPSEGSLTQRATNGLATYHYARRDKNVDLVTDHVTSSYVPQPRDRPDNGLTPLVQAQAGHTHTYIHI